MKRWYNSTSILLVVLISILGVLMAGLMLLLIPRPPEVVRAMMRRMAATRTFHVETKLSWRGTAGPTGAKKDIAYTLETKGDVDRTAPSTYRSSHDFVATVDGERFAGAYRRNGDARLYRFSDLPDRIGGVSFRTLRDRWLRLDHDAVARRFDLPLFGGGRQDLTEEEMTSFVSGLIAVPWVRVDEYVNTERFAEVPVFHYKVSFEPLFIKDLVMRMEAAKLGRDLTAKERAWFDTFFADLVLEPGEVWIGTKDNVLHRARLRARYDDGKRAGVLDLSASFSHLDVPVSIINPTDAVMDATPIVLSLLPGLTGHLPLAADGTLPRGSAAASGGLPSEPGFASGDTDRDGLDDVLESFYGADPRNPDTDGNGVSDGAEVASGEDPVGSGKLFDFAAGRFN